eukprot:285391_1
MSIGKFEWNAKDMPILKANAIYTVHLVKTNTVQRSEPSLPLDLYYTDPILMHNYLKQLLSKKCNGLFTNNMAYKNIKLIDLSKQMPIMLLFVDSFCRLRMDLYYYKRHERRPMDTWGLAAFFDEYGDQIESLIKNSKLQIANKLVTLEELSNGLKSFMYGVLPMMRICEPMTLICDDLNQYTMYVWGITNFISVQTYNSVFDSRPFFHNCVPETLQKPLHIDFMIIPQCTQNVFGDNRLYEDDSDDDNEIDTQTTNDYLLMGFGGRDEHRGGRPMNEIGDISTYLKQCGYKKDRDFWVENISADTFHDIAVIKRIKKAFMGMHYQANVANYGRLIFIIDRRNPQTFTSDSSGAASFSLNNKIWGDRIYCIKPKQYHTMPAEFEYLPESLFCLSQNLMLPPNKKHKNRKIGTKEDLNGYMFTLSYHIYSSRTIRSYFGYQGQIQRFCIKDIALFWPNLFIKRNESLQTIDDKLKRFIHNATYDDDLFFDFGHHLQR